MVENYILTAVLVSRNDSIFIKLFLIALKKLTKNKFKVIICDNGSDKKNQLLLSKIVSSFKNVHLIRMELEAGNKGHGKALDYLINNTDTKYCVVMDSDCIVLKNNWDEIMINSLCDSVKIIGATSPVKRKGNRIGAGDFPLPFLALFETNFYKSMNISCMPGDMSLGQDTCWEWKTKIEDNNYEGKTFTTLNTRDFDKGPFKRLTGVEEYYSNNDLIAAHFGRGGSQGLAKFIKVNGGENIIKLFYLNIFWKIKWIFEIYKWKLICNSIILNQN